MNKNVVFVTFAILAAIGLAGGVYIIAERPDASATFVNLLVLVLGLTTTAAGTFYALGKTNEKLAVVEKQTNGANSELRAENARLTDELVKANRLAHPDNFDATTGATKNGNT